MRKTFAPLRAEHTQARQAGRQLGSSQLGGGGRPTPGTVLLGPDVLLCFLRLFRFGGGSGGGANEAPYAVLSTIESSVRLCSIHRKLYELYISTVNRSANCHISPCGHGAVTDRFV